MNGIEKVYIYKLYQVRDVVTGLFMYPLYTFNNDAEAMRFFKYGIGNGVFPKFSEDDLELYKVGTTNSQTGEIKGTEKEYICNSKEIKGTKEEKI